MTGSSGYVLYISAHQSPIFGRIHDGLHHISPSQNSEPLCDRTSVCGLHSPHETNHPHESFFGETFPPYARTCSTVLCVHHLLAHIFVASTSPSSWDSCSVWAAYDTVLKAVSHSCHLINQSAKSSCHLIIFPGRHFQVLHSHDFHS